MYYCTSCNKTSSPREPQALVFTFREDRSIASQKPVCVMCSTGKPFVDNREVEKLVGFSNKIKNKEQEVTI